MLRPARATDLARLAAGLADAVAELQEVSRGIHPAILSERGLGPALRALAPQSGGAGAGTHITVDLPLKYEWAQDAG
jgi:signal transduction histidine kinase